MRISACWFGWGCYRRRALTSWLAGLGASTVCLSVLVCGSVCQSVLERERGEERQLVSRAIVSSSARHLIALRLLRASSSESMDVM